jgi:hypothetical protein
MTRALYLLNNSGDYPDTVSDQPGVRRMMNIRFHHKNGYLAFLSLRSLSMLSLPPTQAIIS